MQITFHPFFISVNTVHNNKKSSFIHEEQEGFCECYQRSAKHYDGAEEAMRWQSRGVTTLVVTSGEILHLFPNHHLMYSFLNQSLSKSTDN
jgi:hypothetical protein